MNEENKKKRRKTKGMKRKCMVTACFQNDECMQLKGMVREMEIWIFALQKKISERQQQMKWLSEQGLSKVLGIGQHSPELQ